jgi:hypothetical protein
MIGLWNSGKNLEHAWIKHRRVSVHDRIEIAGDKIHFYMLSNDDTVDLKLKYRMAMNDCSSDEIDLSTGTHRIWFTN